jgi:hypothetical protein
LERPESLPVRYELRDHVHLAFDVLDLGQAQERLGVFHLQESNGAQPELREHEVIVLAGVSVPLVRERDRLDGRVEAHSKVLVLDPMEAKMTG